MSTDLQAELDRIRAEIADSFDEELEMQFEEDRLEKLAGGEERPGGRRSIAESISASCSGSSTNWSGCRTGSSTRS